MATVALLSTTGCNRMQKDIFDESAAERLQMQEETIRTYLTSAVNGWEMLYFPHPDAAGYAFLMDFEADGSVKIAAKNTISTRNNYEEETSLWSMDGTQGCVLTFHSYNTIFSIFADPGSDGVGHSGDYEFFVLSGANDHQIRLKGKKNGAYIQMNKLTDDQDWKQYFNKIDYYNAEAFDDNDGIDMILWDGASEMLMTYDGGTFTYEKDGEEITRGFIITPTGIHFYTGFLMADSVTYAKDFDLAADKQTLTTADGSAFISSTYSAADFFVYKFSKYSRWFYEDEGTDTQTQNAVQAIRDKASAKGATINNMAYERTETVNARGQVTLTYALYISYLVENKVFGGRITLTYKQTGDQIKLSYRSYDKALNPLFARLADTTSEATAMFSDIFCDTFTPKSYSGSGLNMTQLLLEAENGKAIHVRADKIIL